MNYLVLFAVLCGLFLYFVRRKRNMLRRNFDRYIDMHASVILAKERMGNRRIHGSLILELMDYGPELRSVYVSRLKSRNQDVKIKYFNNLLFEVNMQGKSDIKLLSIGIRISKDTEQTCKENRERIYVGGKLYLEGKRGVPFGKYLSVRSIR